MKHKWRFKSPANPKLVVGNEVDFAKGRDSTQFRRDRFATNGEGEGKGEGSGRVGKEWYERRWGVRGVMWEERGDVGGEGWGEGVRREDGGEGCWGGEDIISDATICSVVLLLLARPFVASVWQWAGTLCLDQIDASALNWLSSHSRLRTFRN